MWRLQNNTYLSKMVWRPDSSKENYAINEKSKVKKMAYNCSVSRCEEFRIVNCVSFKVRGFFVKF